MINTGDMECSPNDLEKLRSCLVIMGSMSLPDEGHKQKVLKYFRERSLWTERIRKCFHLGEGEHDQVIKMGKSRVSKAERGRRGQMEEDYSQGLV